MDAAFCDTISSRKEKKERNPCEQMMVKQPLLKAIFKELPLRSWEQNYCFVQNMKLIAWN